MSAVTNIKREREVTPPGLASRSPSFAAAKRQRKEPEPMSITDLAINVPEVILEVYQHMLPNNYQGIAFLFSSSLSDGLEVAAERVKRLAAMSGLYKSFFSTEPLCKALQAPPKPHIYRPAACPSTHLTTILSISGQRYDVKVKGSTAWSQLTDLALHITGRREDTVRLLYQGERRFSHETIEDCGMVEGDFIEVHEAKMGC